MNVCKSFINEVENRIRRRSILSPEITDIWNVCSIEIILVVLSSNGLISVSIGNKLRWLRFCSVLLAEQMQKVLLFDRARMVYQL